MDRAVLAGRFGITESAMIESAQSIFQQFSAFVAWAGLAMVSPAVHAHHRLYGMLLSLYAHRYILRIAYPDDILHRAWSIREPDA
jgi:hypothetical protein